MPEWLPWGTTIVGVFATAVMLVVNLENRHRARVDSMTEDAVRDRDTDRILRRWFDPDGEHESLPQMVDDMRKRLTAHLKQEEDDVKVIDRRLSAIEDKVGIPRLYGSSES